MEHSVKAAIDVQIAAMDDELREQGVKQVKQLIADILEIGLPADFELLSLFMRRPEKLNTRSGFAWWACFEFDTGDRSGMASVFRELFRGFTVKANGL